MSLHLIDKIILVINKGRYGGRIDILKSKASKPPNTSLFMETSPILVLEIFQMYSVIGL